MVKFLKPTYHQSIIIKRNGNYGHQSIQKNYVSGISPELEDKIKNLYMHNPIPEDVIEAVHALKRERSQKKDYMNQNLLIFGFVN